MSKRGGFNSEYKTGNVLRRRNTQKNVPTLLDMVNETETVDKYYEVKEPKGSGVYDLKLICTHRDGENYKNTKYDTEPVVDTINLNTSDAPLTRQEVWSKATDNIQEVRDKRLLNEMCHGQPIQTTANMFSKRQKYDVGYQLKHIHSEENEHHRKLIYTDYYKVIDIYNGQYEMIKYNPKPNPRGVLGTTVFPINEVDNNNSWSLYTEFTYRFNPPKRGGSSNKKNTKTRTEETAVFNGRKYIVYKGPRGGKYIKSKGEFKRI